MTPRPGVVVYVTRSGPDEWELLMFDVVDRPEFTAVVPGGGIEPGESAEAAAVREVLEETGVAVRPLRELGASGAFRFVHAAPFGPTEDEWEHRNPLGPGVESEELVRCYWEPLRAGLTVWGIRGELLPALKRQRVVAYITREGENGREVLVFEDPKHLEIGVQVPAGRLDPGEELEPALLREIEEEAGLTDVRIVRELPDFESHYESKYDNHGFHVTVDGETPDAWDHVVQGEGDDAGLTFHYRWVPIEDDLHLFERPHPLLRELTRPIDDM